MPVIKYHFSYLTNLDFGKVSIMIGLVHYSWPTFSPHLITEVTTKPIFHPRVCYHYACQDVIA